MSVSNIFISYSHSDRQWVREFVDSLAELGVSVWYDENELQPGELWADAIENALRSCDTLVFVITPDSIRRPSGLYFELGAALGLGKRIVPIVPEDLDSSLLPQPLRIRQFVYRESPTQTAQALVSRAVATPALAST